MTYTDIQFILMLIGFIAFVFIVVPLLKILVMIDVFGWEKTKELLQDPEWSYGNGKKIEEKLEQAEGGMQ